MKKILLLIAASMVLMSASNCEKTPDSGGSNTKGTLSVDKQEIVLNHEAGTQTVKVTADCDWGVSSDNREWITVSPSGGMSGKTDVTVKIAANKDKADRTGSVTFRYGTEKTVVTVKQAHDPAFDQEEKQDPEMVVPEGYKLVWQDEFNEGTYPDSNKWRHEVKNSGWVNNELQNYVSGRSPKGQRVTEIKDGALLINCFMEDGKVYSGRIYGNVNTGWQYGYVEARINLPSGKGTWPAFWMMPVHFTSWPHDGEIDIMEEVGYHKDYVSSSLHADGHVHSNNTQVTKEVYCKGAEGEYHVYGMEWTKDYFQFYVDGKKTLYYKNPGTGVRDWPYDAPFYVILNLAWGGDWGGSQGVDYGALPVTMKVDYVRVFQKIN